MRSGLIILLCLAVLLSLFLPAIEAAASRRRGKAGRRGAVSSSRRGKQQGRRGRVASGRSKQLGRRGRQDADVAEADPNAVDGGEEELHNGCDWKTNIGGFLNFCKWRKWCADEKGITDFGPYGGVPEESPLPAEEEWGEE